MKAICSLLPGADAPILYSENSGDEEEEDGIELDDEEDTESEDIFNESVTCADTNGDFSRTLPQPTKEMMQPLELQCDPVSLLHHRS